MRKVRHAPMTRPTPTPWQSEAEGAARSATTPRLLPARRRVDRGRRVPRGAESAAALRLLLRSATAWGCVDSGTSADTGDLATLGHSGGEVELLEPPSTQESPRDFITLLPHREPATIQDSSHRVLLRTIRRQRIWDTRLELLYARPNFVRHKVLPNSGHCAGELRVRIGSPFNNANVRFPVSAQ